MLWVFQKLNIFLKYFHFETQYFYVSNCSITVLKTVIKYYISKQENFCKINFLNAHVYFFTYSVHLCQFINESENAHIVYCSFQPKQLQEQINQCFQFLEPILVLNAQWRFNYWDRVPACIIYFLLTFYLIQLQILVFLQCLKILRK